MSDALVLDEIKKLVLNGRLKKALKLSEKMIACSSYQDIEVYLTQYLIAIFSSKNRRYLEKIEFTMVNHNNCLKTVINEMELFRIIFLIKNNSFQDSDLQKIIHIYDEKIVCMLEGLMSYKSKHYKYAYKLFDKAANLTSDVILSWFYEYIINIYIHKTAVMGYGMSFHNIITSHSINTTSHLDRVGMISKGKIHIIVDDLLFFI